MRKRSKTQRICPSCGRIEMVRTDQLNNACAPCGRIRSGEYIGRFAKENPDIGARAGRKHGMHSHRLYRIHQRMMARCGHRSYRHRFADRYEDRGIRVCDEWHDKEAFFLWSFANGYADNLEIDRVDPDKGYSPENCRWVTHKENQNNRTCSRSRRWSKHGPNCIECGTSSRRHVAHGLCSPCYQRARSTSPSPH